MSSSLLLKFYKKPSYTAMGQKVPDNQFYRRVRVNIARIISRALPRFNSRYSVLLPLDSDSDSENGRADPMLLDYARTGIN